mmetsp:Transcript_28847/g.67158  ORF Transcript_28847/g.67158 Transcript_28847/m.67158 type:complete len:90 (+) Transcript_28847:605-874(+)
MVTTTAGAAGKDKSQKSAMAPDVKTPMQFAAASLLEKLKLAAAQQPQPVQKSHNDIQGSATVARATTIFNIPISPRPHSQPAEAISSFK